MRQFKNTLKINDRRHSYAQLKTEYLSGLEVGKITLKKLLILLICSSLLFVACGKNEDIIQTEDEHNYAINEVSTQQNEETETDTVEETTDIIIATEETTEETHEPIIAQDMYYNMDPDVNLGYLTDFYTISIDNKLISFPCDYNYLVEKFGTLYTQDLSDINESYFPLDITEKSNYFNIYALPQSGSGIINFEFVGDTEDTIDHLTCKKISILGGNNTNDKIMSCALPYNLSFGSSYTDIINALGKSTDSKSFVRNNENDFMLFYKIDSEYNKNAIDLQLSGYDGGLFIITITYNE